MNSKQIAESLEEIATLLELQGANTFRVRAFNNASRILRSLESDLKSFVRDASDGKVKGIGPALSGDIESLYETGELPFLDELRESFPDTLLEILNIPGLGAKKVKALYEQLEIESIDELEQACKDQQLAQLKGFSNKTEINILESIERYRKFSTQFLFRDAFSRSAPLLKALKETGLADELEVAGSLRRAKEVVKDIDIIATSKKPEKLMQAFVELKGVIQVIAHGETKSSVLLESGLAVDLRVVSKKEFPAALLHFTGSKEHNTVLRSMAIKKDLKLNEYGLFKGEKALSLKSEEEIYNKLDLCWIPPELREDLGEIDNARTLLEKNKAFPEFLKVKDIKGILHAHSTYSDGENTLEEMALACKKAGYQYLGITDHSQSAAYAGGLKPAALKKQQKEIDELNEKLAPFKILKGIESDILADGSLDYSKKVLESFDFIIASIHSQFNLSEKDQTKRIIKAVSNPFTTILGHPTGRLLLKREGYELNLPAVIEACAEHGVAIELNANPRRLDLDWRFISKAKSLGVSVPINPDAHSVEGISHVAFGVNVARKAGLTKKDSLSCLTLKKLEEYFEARKI